MSLEEFEQWIAAAMEALPEPFKQGLDNLEIMVSERPTLAQQRSIGLGYVLYGLYEGIPLPERASTSYSAVEPDRITLFSDALRQAYPDPQELAAQVRHTLYHELAHHFGIDDDRLTELDAY